MIEINLDVEIGQGLSRLQNLFDDMTPFYQNISEILKEASRRAFRDQADPSSGASWAPLSPVTVKRRGSSKPILKVTGDMEASVWPGFNGYSAWISSNIVYAKTQFFGAKKGAFGYSIGGHFRRVTPIPWGDIPARRFMGLGQEDKDEIVDFIKNKIKQAVGA